jgi:DNA-binding NarL/FixJ family response regulator
VCLVEPEDDLRRGLTARLERDGKLRVSAFASAAEALELLKRQPVDVVIAGEPAGGAGSAALLREVQVQRPEVIRMVLCTEGSADVFRRVPFAHQFLGRSEPLDSMHGRVVDCLEMGTLLVQQRLRSLVSSSNALPAAPAVYDRLLHVLADPRCSLVRVADVIESDVAMSARLLQLVSSAFFGPATKMTSLGACVASVHIHPEDPTAAQTHISTTLDSK